MRPLCQSKSALSIPDRMQHVPYGPNCLHWFSYCILSNNTLRDRIERMLCIIPAQRNDLGQVPQRKDCPVRLAPFADPSESCNPFQASKGRSLRRNRIACSFTWSAIPSNRNLPSVSGQSLSLTAQAARASRVRWPVLCCRLGSRRRGAVALPPHRQRF